MVAGRLLIPMVRNGLLFYLMYISTARGVAQKLERVNQPRKAAPFVVVMYDQSGSSFIADHVKNPDQNGGFSYLLAQVESTSAIPSAIDSINYVLNYSEGIDLQRCYLLVVGSEDFGQSLSTIDENQFFSSKYFLVTGEESAAIADFEVRLMDQASLPEILSSFDDSYLWQVRLSEIQEENVSDLNQNAIESGLLFRANAVIPSYSGLEHSVKPFFRTFSLGFYHRWGRRWQSSLDFTLGLNMPSRNRIQNEIQPGLISGEEVEVDIQAHVLSSFNFETRYLFMPENHKLNPYVGLRFGRSSIRFTEANIEVDPSSISRSSFDSFDEDDFQTLKSPVVGLSSGLQMTLSPKFAADFGVSWNQDLASLERNEQYFNNVSFSVGLHFRFTGKKELFYDFIKNSK